jgi:hypothetical protein
LQEAPVKFRARNKARYLQQILSAYGEKPQSTITFLELLSPTEVQNGKYALNPSKPLRARELAAKEQSWRPRTTERAISSKDELEARNVENVKREWNHGSYKVRQ